MIVDATVDRQHVVGEITSWVTPHRVNVVRATSGVVVLGQQDRAVEPVVVGLTRLETARPQQMDLIERRTGELGTLVGGELVGKTFRVAT